MMAEYMKIVCSAIFLCNRKQKSQTVAGDCVRHTNALESGLCSHI